MASGDQHRPPQDIEPAATLLTRALKIQPLKQGQLDGLCGLYAGINALRLLLAAERPLSSRETKRSFRAGVRALSKRERLAAAVLNGIPDKTWRKLLVKLAGSATAGTGPVIAISQPLQHRTRVSRTELMEIIETAIDSRQPVVISLSGKHRHYTVVCGYTPGRFLLFDSSSLSWLKRELCGPSQSRREWRHEIDTASLTVLCFSDAQAAQTD
jgi:hypothetical protein